MSIDWRDTLQTLSTQFQSQASRSQGLHHLFVEVADHERDKLAGPPWFERAGSSAAVIDGEPKYSKWDCSAFDSLPMTGPGYRQVESTDAFEADDPRVVRDLSGVARAVATPMKLRSGYFCGRPSEEVHVFKSLADAAAAALTGADDLDRHAFAAELTDVFRKPRGGVRYIFGDVPSVPDHFVARGWSAGVLLSQNGVLIDLPIAESSPDATHWVCLLHRLGWHSIEGTVLNSVRLSRALILKHWASRLRMTFLPPTEPNQVVNPKGVR